ncbi:hypothetical protein V1527DRAFT_478034 [Lipomyces starkeyi]
MPDILIVASDPYSVSFRDTGVVLTSSDQLPKPGDYDIKSNSPGGVTYFYIIKQSKLAEVDRDNIYYW